MVMERGLSVVAGVALAMLALGPVKAESNIMNEAKIESLINEMTLEEKVGQLNQYSGFWDFTGPQPASGEAQMRARHVAEGRVGSMLNVVGVEQVRAMQEIAVEETRLGIPLLFAFDVIHGHRTIFPIPLAEAASWDLEAIEDSARVSAREASAQGVNWTFAPMVDISRDARWGRVMEGAGEDPYLGSRMAVARVRGFQGTDLAAVDTILASAKHFAAYGFAEAGRDYNTAEISAATLFNVVLPPFQAAIEEINVRAVMNSFNTVNGVPATGDPFLQRTILKGKWGFDGLVVSDWGSSREMIEHGFAEDLRHAAELALVAGSDMDMESTAYLNHLAGLVREGVVEESLVDDAVRRVLRLKMEVGLFDDPYRYLDEKRERRVLSDPSHGAAALDMARKSIVLLKNDDALLPLRAGKRIGVIGALAADKDTPLGNWRGRGESDSAVSVLEGLEAKGIAFTYAKGADVEIGTAAFSGDVKVNETDRSGFAEAITVAQQSDVVIMVLGEDGLQSGEGRSRASLDLPGVQEDLLRAVHGVNPNIVLVVMSGRPLVLTWADENIPAIVQAWHLGSESGHALASVLSGETNPSGKLPMTFPRSVGQVPIYYNHLPTGRPGPQEGVFWSRYSDERNEPLHAFGHGLSYTTFDYSALYVQSGEGPVRVSVNVTNTGARTGTETVQLYIRDRVARISRPVKELKAFRKVTLVPRETRTIVFTLTQEDLGYFMPDGSFRTDPGTFDLFVGGSSSDTISVAFDWP